MEKGYVLFVIFNDVKRFRQVKKTLNDLGYDKYTVFDTYGTTDVLTSMEFSNMLTSTMSGQSNKRYNKTMFMVLEDEAQVEEVMDTVEKVQNLDLKKPGKGIMFTIPIYASKGIRFE